MWQPSAHLCYMPKKMNLSTFNGVTPFLFLFYFGTEVKQVKHCDVLPPLPHFCRSPTGEAIFVLRLRVYGHLPNSCQTRQTAGNQSRALSFQISAIHRSTFLPILILKRISSPSLVTPDHHFAQDTIVPHGTHVCISTHTLVATVLSQARIIYESSCLICMFYGREQG